MRIALCTDVFAPHVGGTEGVMLALIKEYIKKGHDVAVFTQDLMLDNSEYDKKQNYPIYRTRSCKNALYPMKFRPKKDKKIENILRDFCPNVIHSHTPNVIGMWMGLLAKKICIPSVLTNHTFNAYMSNQNAPFSKNNPLHKLFSYIPLVYPKYTASLYDVNTGVSEFVIQKELRDIYKLKTPIVLIKNGYDPTSLRFDPIEHYKNHYDKDRITLLFVGRVVKEKNLEFSLKICKKLKEKNIPYTFTLIGDGDIQHFKKIASELSISSNVHFLGLKQKDEIGDYYSSSDILLFPSAFDADSLVEKEAFSHGCPSLVLENTGPAEQIINGVNGFALGNDENVFSDKIEKLYRLKCEGFDSFVKLRESTKNYRIPTWSEIADKYIALYTKLINKEQIL